MKLRKVPTLFATGGFVLQAGLGKWRGEPNQAAAVHGMASDALSFLKAVRPPTFLKASP